MSTALPPIPTTVISRAAGLTSRAQRRLFEQLLFRRGDPAIATREIEPEKQVCWLVPERTRTRTLVVPTMMGWWESNGVYSATTIARLTARDLVALSASQVVPDYLPTRLHGQQGTSIALTERAMAIREGLR